MDVFPTLFDFDVGLLLEATRKVELDTTTTPFYLSKEYPSRYASWHDWFTWENAVPFLDVPRVPSDNGDDKGAIIMAVRKVYIALLEIHCKYYFAMEQLFNACKKGMIGDDLSNYPD